MKVRRKSNTIYEAFQFDPEVEPWPKFVFPYDGIPSRGRKIHGYIVAFGIGQIPVHAGDWILTHGTDHVVVHPETFAQEYEALE